VRGGGVTGIQVAQRATVKPYDLMFSKIREVKQYYSGEHS
jgi:hypothetical protein